MKVRESIVIDRPIEEVFDFIQDIDNQIEIRPEVIDGREIRAGDEPGVGTRWEMVIEAAGRHIKTAGITTVYEPPHRVEFEDSSGPVAFHGKNLYEPAGGGTRVTIEMVGQPTGLLRLAAPVLARQMRSNMRAGLLRAKAILEGRNRD